MLCVSCAPGIKIVDVSCSLWRYNLAVIKNLIKKIVPRQFPASLKNYKILSHDFGQFNSMQSKQCVDRQGNEIPWYTYPAIEYIKQLDLSDKRIFEYGSGNSTIFWSSRCHQLISVEHDEHWYQQICHRLPENVDYHFQESVEDYVNVINATDEDFDIIIIDGSYRYDCTTEAIKKLKPSGFIILDNSDWMTNSSQLLREADLIEVDMSGFGPINNYTWTTSFYFSRQVELKSSADMQPQAGIGHSIQSG